MILRKITLLIAVILLHSQMSNSLHAACTGCARGEAILAGVSGASAAVGGIFTLDNLYVYNTVTGLSLFFGAGTPITFNSTPLVAGTGISETTPSTFTITKTGHYLANFVASTALTIGGGVEYTLNGVPQGVTSAVAVVGAPLILNQILHVTTVPTTLQVVVTGTGLSLATGTSATLSIVEVSTP